MAALCCEQMNSDTFIRDCTNTSAGACCLFSKWRKTEHLKTSQPHNRHYRKWADHYHRWRARVGLFLRQLWPTFQEILKGTLCNSLDYVVASNINNAPNDQLDQGCPQLLPQMAKIEKNYQAKRAESTNKPTLNQN